MVSGTRAAEHTPANFSKVLFFFVSLVSHGSASLGGRPLVARACASTHRSSKARGPASVRGAQRTARPVSSLPAPCLLCVLASASSVTLRDGGYSGRCPFGPIPSSTSINIPRRHGYAIFRDILFFKCLSEPRFSVFEIVVRQPFSFFKRDSNRAWALINMPLTRSVSETHSYRARFRNEPPGSPHPQRPGARGQRPLVLPTALPSVTYTVS